MPTLAPVRVRPLTRESAPTPAALRAVAPLRGMPTVYVPTGLLTHTLRHGVFAEQGCAHCSRSYERAMLRYQR